MNFCDMIKVVGLVFACSFFSALIAQSNVYTWRDGDRQQTIYLSTNYIAELQDLKLSEPEKITKIIPIPSETVKSALVKGALPKTYSNHYSEVFEEGEGGRKMALPGGIFVEFHEDWDEIKVKEWATSKNLPSPYKVLSLRNIYRIHTLPGIDNLHLANRLLREGGVKSAFPNWWRESSRR